MSMASQPFETLEGQGLPTVRQISLFLDNRLGQLLRLTKLIEGKDIRILALSVIDSVDVAIVRLLFDNPDEAAVVLREEGFAISIKELLVVKLPPGKRGLLSVFSALLSAEVNIAYAYPLLPVQIGSAIAMSVDNLDMASDTLKRNQFTLLSEADLQSGPEGLPD